jgi:hypothetical protein
VPSIPPLLNLHLLSPVRSHVLRSPAVPLLLSILHPRHLTLPAVPPLLLPDSWHEDSLLRQAALRRVQARTEKEQSVYHLVREVYTRLVLSGIVEAEGG